jgi:hypothetical protein
MVHLDVCERYLQYPVIEDVDDERTVTYMPVLAEHICLEPFNPKTGFPLQG